MSDSLWTLKGCIEKICSENSNPKCLICGKGINNFNNVYFLSAFHFVSGIELY